MPTENFTRQGYRSINWSALANTNLVTPPAAVSSRSVMVHPIEQHTAEASIIQPTTSPAQEAPPYGMSCIREYFRRMEIPKYAWYPSDKDHKSNLPRTSKNEWHFVVRDRWITSHCRYMTLWTSCWPYTTNDLGTQHWTLSARHYQLLSRKRAVILVLIPSPLR